ncbi:hypothetical protein [Formosa sp. L2A11]|uniref:hypothetical protein n=1 Tax=Formosa sp. L2A11 TaxID=2686363 RepID=UPI00131C4C2F|nr:hypothetical protein [Formosa sp. L2A11]
MRKTILSVAVSLLSLALFGQSFPEDNPELLLNKTVKPKEINESLQQYAYKNFFLEFDKEQKQFTKNEKNNKPFPSGPSYSLVSDYSKLVGKEFKVLEIFEIIPKYSFSGKEYAIELENPEIGVIFYKYNPKYESSYELEVVGGLDYPEDFFCSKIEYQKDKFEDKETFFSPYENGISFMKTIVNGKPTIYLSVRINGSTPNVGKKGLNLLFEDGSKLTRPEADIDVKVSGGSGYIYSAFIEPTPSEIKLLTEKNITDKRLYIYDGTVDIDSAKKIRAYLKCLSK